MPSIVIGMEVQALREPSGGARPPRACGFGSTLHRLHCRDRALSTGAASA